MNKTGSKKVRNSQESGTSSWGLKNTEIDKKKLGCAEDAELATAANVAAKALDGKKKYALMKNSAALWTVLFTAAILRTRL